MLLLEEKNKMFHLRLKAYLQAFMFGKEKVHGDVTILCNSSLPSSEISMYRCGFCFCLDLSMLYTSKFDLVCLMESLVTLLFNVVITISSFLFSSSPCCHFFMDSPLSRIEHISKYSSIENFMKLPFQRVVIHRKRNSNKGAMSVLLQRYVLSKTDFRMCCTR
jgi:hypothetical protein